MESVRHDKGYEIGVKINFRERGNNIWSLVPLPISSSPKTGNDARPKFHGEATNSGSHASSVLFSLTKFELHSVNQTDSKPSCLYANRIHASHIDPRNMCFAL